MCKAVASAVPGSTLAAGSSAAQHVTSSMRRLRALQQLRGGDGIGYVRVAGDGENGRYSGGKIKGVFTSEDQATEWIKANVLTPVGSLKDVDLDYAYDILASVQRAEGLINGKVSESVVFKGLPKNELARFDSARMEIAFSNTDINHVAIAMFDNAYYMKKHSIPYHVDATTDGLVFHEVAHSIDKAHGDAVSRAVRFLSDKDRTQLRKLSGRARASLARGHEAAAEAICAVLVGSERVKFIPKTLLKEIEEVLK